VDNLSAKEIARELLSDLKSGKLTKIGIDEVRAAVRARVPNFTEDFVGLVTRKLVMMV
jgi:hypothetical protein